MTVMVLTLPEVEQQDDVVGYDCWCCGAPWEGVYERYGHRVCWPCAYGCVDCFHSGDEVLATALWPNPPLDGGPFDVLPLCADCWTERERWDETAADLLGA